MIKQIIKYIYLILGIVHYFVINYISYYVEPYSTGIHIGFKILFSIISLIILTIVYILILKPTLLTKKALKTETYIALYIGVLVVPLISLAY